MSALPKYVWEKFYSESQVHLWKMWTERDLLASWYGPNVDTIIHKIDVRQGGEALIEMRWANGQSQFQKFEYIEVQKPSELSWIQSITDQSWAPTHSPQMQLWPKQLLTTVSISVEGGRNCLHFSWIPHGSVSQEEVDYFKSVRLDVDAGWKASMEIFEKVLKQGTPEKRR